MLHGKELNKYINRIRPIFKTNDIYPTALT